MLLACDVSDMYADIVQVPASAKPSRTCREGLALPGSALRRRCTGDAQPKHVKKIATGMIPPRTRGIQHLVTWRCACCRARRGCEAAAAKRREPQPPLLASLLKSAKSERGCQRRQSSRAIPTMHVRTLEERQDGPHGSCRIGAP